MWIETSVMGDIKFGIFIKIMSKYLQTLFPIFSIFLSKVQGAVTDDINTINSRVTTV